MTGGNQTVQPEACKDMEQPTYGQKNRNHCIVNNNWNEWDYNLSYIVINHIFSLLNS